MAALYGRLQGGRGEATRVGSSTIKAKLETWEGSIEVELAKDGSFIVRIGDKSYPRVEVATGNVNDSSFLVASDRCDHGQHYRRCVECEKDHLGRQITT